MTFFKQAFGSILQQVLLGALIIAIVLITQPWSKDGYRVGLVLLMASALLEMGAGNVPANAKFGKSVMLLAITLVIVGIVFGIGILLAPKLVALGGGR